MIGAPFLRYEEKGGGPRVPEAFRLQALLFAYKYNLDLHLRENPLDGFYLFSLPERLDIFTMNFWAVPVTILLALSTWTLFSLRKNLQSARQTGLPILLSPVTPLNPFWILTCRIFPQILSLKHLPFGLGTWTRCAYMGWAFDDKHALHAELGEVFTLVTPGGNEVVIADPETARAVFLRRKEFIKPAVIYGKRCKRPKTLTPV